MAEEKERVLTYEVHVHTGGRWEIYSRFPADCKDDAVDVAKELEKNKSTASVKVVKEVYNRDSNTSSEFLVYKSSGKAEAAPTAPSPPPPRKEEKKKPERKPPERERKAAPPPKRADRKGQAPEPDAEASLQEAPKKGSGSLAGVLLKLLVITFLAGAFAFGAGTLVTLVLKNSHAFGIAASTQVREAIVLATFIVSFLVSAVPMALYSLSRENLDFNFSLPRRRPVPAPQASAAATDAVRAATKATAGMSFADRMQAERRVADVVAGKSDAADDATEAKAPPPKFEMPAPAVQLPPLSPHAERQKAAMLKYLGEAMGRIPPSRKMDNYNKFGANLFLAGACEAMATEKQLDVLSTSRILAESLKTLGFKNHQAQAFADKYQEYLLADSRYMAMFESGRAAMAEQMEGKPEAAERLAQSLEDWNRPKDMDEKQTVVTVMFTDMVGSTALTQTLGDAAAQKVVRAHNAIVRAALGRFRGKEIKHTGDGIMASFQSTTDGIKAAIDIQKNTAEHNRTNPGLPLKLKVGLHSGQAIAEDDDLFGTHVQLTARIVDKAGPGEIFVSETAHGICAGKDIQFANRGQFNLKGFDQPQTIYQVVLDADKAAEDARKKAEAARKKEEEEERRRAEEAARPQPEAPPPAAPAPAPAPTPQPQPSSQGAQQPAAPAPPPSGAPPSA
jgi:class 3 adenylate cyclase